MQLHALDFITLKFGKEKIKPFNTILFLNPFILITEVLGIITL